MAESFVDLGLEMGEARESLRSFTLGRQGFTRRDGTEAIGRVNDLCERLEQEFGSGSHADEVAGTVSTARNQVQAALARLVILRRKAAAARNRAKR
jgi:hypothetical protein